MAELAYSFLKGNAVCKKGAQLCAAPRKSSLQDTVSNAKISPFRHRTCNRLPVRPTPGQEKIRKIAAC
jgi:hypothetical protein